MSMRRWGSYAALLLVTISFVEVAAAHPPEEPPPLPAQLEGCEGLPVRRALTRYEPVGEDAMHVVGVEARVLVFPQQENGCEVYPIGPIGRAPARASGRFTAKASKVFALRPKQCGGGLCPVALAVRGKAERPLFALRTRAHCDVSVVLRPIKLFPDHDSIEMVCQNSAGAGWKEQRFLFDVSGDTLLTLHSFETGSYQPPTAEEKKHGARALCPVGSLKVEKKGERPLVRVVDASSGALQDGKGSLPARQLGYDPDRHELVPTGAPDVATPVDARAACRKR